MVHYVPGEAEADDTISTLRIGMVQSIDSLNPFIGINDNAYIFYGLVYDYLICLDEDLQPKPNLAVSWNVVEEYDRTDLCGSTISRRMLDGTTARRWTPTMSSSPSIIR